MIKITDIEVIRSVSILFLDAETPNENWNKLIIEGIKYDPVPVYDMKKVVAVIGSGFPEDRK